MKRTEVPRECKGSTFTLPFRQVALTPKHEILIIATARIITITDKRLSRIVNPIRDYPAAAVHISSASAIVLDETASTHGHNYITALIDRYGAEQVSDVVLILGHRKAMLQAFTAFLNTRKNKPRISILKGATNCIRWH